MSEVELLFLGSGTSAGIPMIGCHCAVCESADPRDKRMRPSALISYGATQVLIDATPELRLQCVAHKIDRVDAVVITHHHADHVMGLDDLRRFNALSRASLDIWADKTTHESLTRCFGYAFIAPEPALKLFRPHLVRRYIDGAFSINDIPWTPIPLFHGDMPVLGFRIGRVAYCTDVSRIPDESFPLLENLDVLILDALQHTRHTTHFSIEQAIEAARRINAGKTYFTHIAHGISHEQTSAALPPGIFLGYDGLRVRGRA